MSRILLLLIFEKIMSVIASPEGEAIPCLISSFSLELSVRLLRREVHPPRNDGEVRLLIFKTQ